MNFEFPSEIYIEHDENHDTDLLNTIKMLLRRDYDIRLRNEEGATVIEFDNASYKGYGNPTFEYITQDEREMIWDKRKQADNM